MSAPGPRRAVLVLLACAVLLSGCAGPCGVDRLEAEGVAPGLLAALAAPVDLAPDDGMGLPSWSDGDALVVGHVLSGEPGRLVPRERPFALWYGEEGVGVLFVWGAGVEVQVYAHDEATRDRLLGAVSAVAPGALEGAEASRREVRHEPYFWDFSIDAPVVEPFVLTLPASGVDFGAAGPAGRGGERHLGWWGWALAPERTLHGDGVEVNVGPGDGFTAYVRKRGREAALRGDLEGFLAARSDEVVLSGVRYVEGGCDVLPPET